MEDSGYLNKLKELNEQNHTEKQQYITNLFMHGYSII